MQCISVCPWREMSTYYFSRSGGPGAVSVKSTLGHVRKNLWFLHPVGSTGHIVHPSASEARNDIALFFMLRWA
jgi:hypothetical protein